LQRHAVPGYGRKRKHLYLEYKQYDVPNEAQGT
jgi:hypothetical protein